MRLVAEPSIDDNGVRKSCEIEASSVLRTRSVSVAVLALTMSRASEARSSAAAVCSDSASSSARASESSGVDPFRLGYADHAQRLIADPQRHEVPRHDRQRAGVGASRLAMAEGPTRRRHRCGIERIFRRPSGDQRQIAVLLQQHHHGAAEAGVDFAGRAFGHRIERRQSRQAAGEFVEPPHRPHAARPKSSPARARGRRAPR